MAINDELDRLLRDFKMTKDDWNLYKEVLGFDAYPNDKSQRDFINEQIRHYYGHTFANLFRTIYEPDYIDIVKETATKLKITLHPHFTVPEIENKILIEIMESAKAKIIKEQGEAAWRKIEQEIEQEVQKLIDSGQLDQNSLAALKQFRGIGIMGALFAGKLAGFALYIVANQLFFALARALGLKIGVAVAGPIIGKALAFLLGPAGWILAGALVFYDLGNTNWNKVIPAIVVTSMLRRKYNMP